MFREYTYVSPSLQGVLSHESIAYEGLSRPPESLRLLDGAPADTAAADQRTPLTVPGTREQKLLERYFYDLYGLFMKKLSVFVLASEPLSSETVQLQAMLKEMIKVKKILGRVS